MSGSTMGAGSKDGHLGGAGSIHSFIPVSLVREWALSRGTHRSDQVFPPAGMMCVHGGWPEKGSLQSASLWLSTWHIKQLGHWQQPKQESAKIQ